jgi:hypothetical protein
METTAQMEDGQEREYTSDVDAGGNFVGGVTPEEFLSGYENCKDPIAPSITEYLVDWVYSIPAPSWSREALYSYMIDRLAEGHDM